MISTVYGFSRDLERDADSSGYNRLVAADYDGAAMARSLQLLDEKLEYEPVEPFWRTHPKLQERIATAERLERSESAAKKGPPREVSETDYLDHMASVIRHNVKLDMESRRPRYAIARAQRLVNWHPDDAVNQTLLADAYRNLGAKAPRPDEEELSRRGKAAARKQVLKLTAEEEQKRLMETPAGPGVLEANRAKAESLYRDAIAVDPSLPDAHRGLGMLYQDESKFADAQREYRAYLNLAPPQVPDRLRMERRLELVSRNAGAK